MDAGGDDAGQLDDPRLTAVELGVNFNVISEKLAEQGIHPTPEQNERARDLIVEAEQSGIGQLPHSHLLDLLRPDVAASHVNAFEVTFAVSAGIALLGALVSLFLVRHTDRVKAGPIFSRRSRWVYASQGRSPAITKRPPLDGA